MQEYSSLSEVQWLIPHSLGNLSPNNVSTRLTKPFGIDLVLFEQPECTGIWHEYDTEKNVAVLYSEDPFNSIEQQWYYMKCSRLEHPFGFITVFPEAMVVSGSVMLPADKWGRRHKIWDVGAFCYCILNNDPSINFIANAWRNVWQLALAMGSDTMIFSDEYALEEAGYGTRVADAKYNRPLAEIFSNWGTPFKSFLELDDWWNVDNYWRRLKEPNRRPHLIFNNPPLPEFK